MPGVSGTGVRRARIGRLRPIRSTSVADRLPDLFIVKGLAVDRAQQRHVGADEAASGMHFTRNADFAAQLAIRSTIRRDVGDRIRMLVSDPTGADQVVSGSIPHRETPRLDPRRLSEICAAGAATSVLGSVVGCPRARRRAVHRRDRSLSRRSSSAPPRHPRHPRHPRQSAGPIRSRATRRCSRVRTR